MARAWPSLSAGLAAALIALLATACGGGELQGSGNGVLKVTCEVHYTPMASSAGTASSSSMASSSPRSAAADTSTAVAQVSRDGAPVVDAVVTLVDLDQDQTLPLAGSQGSGGERRGSWAGYRQRLALHVSAGDDFVACELAGPGRHLITQPTPGALHAADRSLVVRWRRDPADRREPPPTDPADTTECRLHSGFLAVSPGSHKITLSQDHLAPGPDMVEVVRRRTLAPSGAAAGSHFTIGYGVAVPFVLQ